MKILFTGGGTGGHIYPIVAIVRELKNICRGAGLQLFYIGPKDNFCRVVLARERVKVRTIATGKIRRYFNPLAAVQNMIDLGVMVPLGTIQSFFHLLLINPDVVVSKGGHGSFPVVLSASLLGIPIFLQESDSTPGLASRKTAKYALEVFVSFSRTDFFSPGKMLITGNPIRKELMAGSKDEAAAQFNLKGGRPLLLVLGGSQGAQRVNDKIFDILHALVADYEIIHQVGPRNIEQAKREVTAVIPAGAEGYYHPVGFVDERTLANAYAAADLIVSRAGSGSIFEIAAVNKPSILIPLPESAQNHQVKNAYAYANQGAALVFEENNFAGHLFLEKIRDLFNSPQTLQSMSCAAADFAKPKAASIIAGYIANYLTR